MDAISKEVITLCNTTYINAQTIVDFLIRIKERYADKPVKIVLDNARYQHCKFVEETAKGLGIELLFLPSYSPNLNIIERLWKFTKRKILYAKYYDTPAKFHSAITGFFNDVSSKYKGGFALFCILQIKKGCRFRQPFHIIYIVYAYFTESMYSISSTTLSE